MNNDIIWPDGKTCAFTIFDDTDNFSFKNTKTVYDYLLKKKNLYK